MAKIIPTIVRKYLNNFISSDLIFKKREIIKIDTFMTANYADHCIRKVKYEDHKGSCP